MPISARPHFQWRLRTRTLALGQRTLLMGILNVTPDSFSDGGHFLSPDAALRHALQMLDDGADLLDLGGESTRPTSTPITPAEEQARVLPVLRAILAARPSTIVSIDTYHAETARLAVEAGAEIVNDVSGGLWDLGLLRTCAALECGNILMHTRGRPHEWHTQPALVPSQVVPFVLRDLEARANAALAAGIVPESIVLDPGFGFGKILDENYPLLARLDQLHALGFPILAGLSRKSFLTRTLLFAAGGAISGEPRAGAPHLGVTDEPGAPHLGVSSEPAPRGERLDSEMWDSSLPTTVANTAAILAGAHILRVHDVRPARQTAVLADRILASTE